MGKLLDKVLEIHKSNIANDISNIEKHINYIDNKIITCAENCKTLLVIHFITIDVTTAEHSDVNYYDYIIQEHKAIPSVKQYLEKHYINEGFDIRHGTSNFIIDWSSKLKDI